MPMTTRAASETASVVRTIKDLQLSRFQGITKRRFSVGCDQYSDTAGFSRWDLTLIHSSCDRSLPRAVEQPSGNENPAESVREVPRSRV